MRRLDSEPGDVFVFDAPAKRAPRPHYAHVLAPRPAQQAAARVSRPARQAAARVSRPMMPTRERRWPLILLTVLAGLGGVIGASYIPLDDAPLAPAVVVLPAAPVAVQAVPAVVPPPAPEATAAPLVQPAALPSPGPTTVHVVKHVHHVKAKRVVKQVSRATPPPVSPAPARAARPTAQRADTENPL